MHVSQKYFEVLITSVCLATGREAVSVEDILSLSVEGVHLDEFHCRSGTTRKLVSIGVQTEPMVSVYPSMSHYLLLKIYIIKLRCHAASLCHVPTMWLLKQKSCG